MPRLLVTDSTGLIFGYIETVNDDVVEVGVSKAHPNGSALLQLNTILQAHRSGSNRPQAKLKPGSAQHVVYNAIRTASSPVTSTQLVLELGLSGNAVTGALKHLVEKGMLKRYKLGDGNWKYEVQ